jgi:DNA-binding transcriptional LysR family regulator
MIPSERLKGIEAFVFTADAGSFTAAAERLHLTNSAVSKSVARLEKRLDSKLFERTTRRLALTEAGAAFYRTCVQVLADLEQAEAVLASHQLEPVGKLRIDLPSTFGRLLVMPLLLAFDENHRRVQLHLSFTDRFVDIIDEGIDMAIRIGGNQNWPAAVGHRHLGTERAIFCASPVYLARKGTPASLADLQTHDVIAFGKSDGSISAWRYPQSEGITAEYPPEARMIVGNADAQLVAVLAGCGIAQMATWLIAGQLQRGELVEILPAMATDGLPLFLVWPRGRQLQPKVAALLNYLTTALRFETPE